MELIIKTIIMLPVISVLSAFGLFLLTAWELK